MRNVILVGVDGSSNSDRALEWATVEANIRNWPLRLVSTFSPAFVADPIVGASYALAARQEAQTVLDHATKRAEAQSVRTETHVECGDATKVLIEHSETTKLAVVGKRGRGGFVGRLLGSVSSGLAAHSHCPTVVVPQAHDSATTELEDGQGTRGTPRSESGEQSTTHPTFFDAVSAGDPPRQQENAINGLSFNGQIVIAVDSGTQGPALWEAAEMARIHGKPLALVSVIGITVSDLGWSPSVEDLDPDYEKELAKLTHVVTAVTTRYPDVKLSRHLFVGKPAEVLVQTTQTADLVVLGTRGLGGFPGLLLGSVSQAVLHHGRSPMMVAPGANTVS
ncbi:universal stress protein [Cryobacterium sp. Hz9]|uniref:universal stress protein n=1 Tax=Cryobacterium sp. Hz9 TaxID=1259167 RepID=UPI00106A549F|nr:universal stress protein [Cryobacterium sp. Hz9]TFB68568.1 universal stress protein [Cryobacterium sp. Hz9]